MHWYEDYQEQLFEGYDVTVPFLTDMWIRPSNFSTYFKEVEHE